MKKLFMLLSIGSLLAGCAGHNQGGTGLEYGSTTESAMQGNPVTIPTPTGNARVSDAEAKFIREAFQHGQDEIQLGQLIVQKGQSQAVKNFGQRLIDDHTTINQRLAQIAAQKGVTLPTGLDSGHQKRVDKLANLTGADFDRAVERDAVRDHEKDIRMYEHADKNLQDPDIKAFTERTIPVLQQHLDLAKQLESAGTTTFPG
ncbi:MAG: outer membrane protein [Pedosphaera sp.]|nr:outer membrane protein [Pedosphaera sp.]